MAKSNERKDPDFLSIINSKKCLHYSNTLQQISAIELRDEVRLLGNLILKSILRKMKNKLNLEDILNQLINCYYAPIENEKRIFKIQQEIKLNLNN